MASPTDSPNPAPEPASPGPAAAAADPTSLPDAALLALLRTEKDTLSRAAIEEVVRRGERLVPALQAILEDDHLWHTPLADSVRHSCGTRHEAKANGDDEDYDVDAFWPLLHAVHALAGIGGEVALPGLLEALRRSGPGEMDWISDALPPALARLGPIGLSPLESVALDPSEHIGTRMSAVEGLGALAQAHESVRAAAMNVVRRLVRDGRGAGNADDRTVLADFAAEELLDLALPEDRSLLMGAARRPGTSLRAADVESAYRDGPQLRTPRDLFQFYDAAEIADRQARWRADDEERRWQAAVDAEEPWVDDEVDALATRFAEGLTELDDAGRAHALWIAERAFDFAVYERFAAPWSWPPERPWEFLEDLVSSADPEDLPAVATAPGNLKRLLRFLEKEGRIEGAERAELEKEIDLDRTRFIDLVRDVQEGRPIHEPLRLDHGEGGDPLDGDGDEGVAGDEDEGPVRGWQAPVVLPPKVGRNAPCPCGSGKKHKKCCGSD